MHNEKTKSLKINENTDVFITPNQRSNEIHIRKKVSSVHWSTYDKGVINVRIHKFNHKDTIELDTSRYANPREAFWFWCSKEAKLYNKKRTTQEKKDFYFSVVEVLNIKGEEE